MLNNQMMQPGHQKQLQVKLAATSCEALDAAREKFEFSTYN